MIRYIQEKGTINLIMYVLIMWKVVIVDKSNCIAHFRFYIDSNENNKRIC